MIKKTPGALILFCLLYFAGYSQDTSISYAYPSKYVIGGLRIDGETSMDKRIVLAYTGLSIGQTVSIPGDEISRAIQNLWKQDFYSDVKIGIDSLKGNKAYLYIALKSRPRLGWHKFEGLGIRKGQKNKLNDELKLSAGTDMVNDQLINRSVEKIKTFYSKKGFSNTKVSVERLRDTNRKINKENLVFHIDRGKKVKIDRIGFSGNNSFTDKKLRRVLKKTKQRQWWNVTRNSKFQQEDYDDDKQKINDFYKAKGYKDFRILKDSVKASADYRVRIGLQVEEGHKYYFRNISWTGNTKYTSTRLASVLGIKKGDVYNQELLERNLTINPSGYDVTSMYMDSGYLFFQVTPVEIRVEDDSVDLEIRIFEGPQAIVNKVTVTGNTRTHDKVILREVRTRPGQKFSRADVIRTQRELVQSGLFDGEKMAVNPKPNAKDGTVDIEYVVAEKPSDQIELSGGWGAGMLVGTLGLSLNNFSAADLFKPKQWQGYPSGDGERLTVRAQTNGPNFQSYNLSFTEPWFGGHKPNSFTTSAFYSIQRIGVIGDPKAQVLKTPGGSLGLGYRLRWPDDYFTFYHSAAYQYYDYHNYTLIPNHPNGYSHNLYYLMMLKRSSTNDPIFPSSGSNITLQLQSTLPYSNIETLLGATPSYKSETPEAQYKWIEYQKWKMNALYFIPIGSKPKKKFTIMTEADFGFITRWNTNAPYTPFERFYVGGDGLTGYAIAGQEYIRFRGYGSPTAVISPSPNGEQGATAYNKYTFELRYSIVNSQAASVYLLGFAEAGNAWYRPRDFNPFELKRSAGVGIRLFLPMFGLLGFDYGYGFDPATNGPNPSGWQPHFFIGQPLF